MVKYVYIVCLWGASNWGLIYLINNSFCLLVESQCRGIFQGWPRKPGGVSRDANLLFFFDLGASHSVEWWQLARGRAWRIPFCRDVGFKKCISGQISHPLTSYFMLFQGTIYIGTRVDMFWLIAISQTHKSCSFFRSSEGRGNFQVPRSQRPKFLWEIPWWRSVCKMHSSCDFQKSCFFFDS